MKASIIISSHNRLALIRRTLWSIATRPPKCDYEVVVCDDGSDEDILGELRQYSSRFPWKFIRVDVAKFEVETGVKKFFNNPSHTNNVAFRHSTGDLIFQQGNEVIAWGYVYDQLIEETRGCGDLFLAFSTTLDVPKEVLGIIDPYGANLHPGMVEYCKKWPLATPAFHTDVTNYISLSSRKLWETLGGYNEEFVGGLGKEDSDFVRRCRAIPGWKDETNLRRSMALSLHQFHGGRTWHYMPDPAVITQERWVEGERLSKAVWDRWDGTHKNPQPWEFGTCGVTEIVSNV